MANNISSDMLEEQLAIEEQLADLEMQVIKSALFRMAMEGKWERVAEVYKRSEWAQTAKITNSGDTALHIAVSVGKEDNVRQLMESISDRTRLLEVLQTGNNRGNTPLHSAASMGNVAICQCIATDYQELVDAPNHNEETPLYMAALHGEKAAFFCLHYICLDKGIDGYKLSRRRNGDTILHSAIAGDYFDLAFQIIHLYPHLASSVNVEGLTPLHLLARKPSAFRSGSHLEGYYKIIYHCILVDQLEVEASCKQPERTDSPGDEKNLNPETSRNGEETETIDEENPGPKAGRPGVEQNLKQEPSDGQPMRIFSGGNKKTPAYPENYRTCNDFFKLLWNTVLVVTGIIRIKRDAAKSEGPKARQQGNYLFPANYATFFEFVKLANGAILTFLGYGFSTIIKIQNEKKKHTWAVQILNELLNHYSPIGDAAYNSSYMMTDLTAVNKSYPRGLQPPGYALMGQGSGESTPYNDPEILRDMGINDNNDHAREIAKKETPILIAAKNGIIEIVEKTLEFYPIAIHDINADNKNIVLMAVEYRQPRVYELLRRKKFPTESLFLQVDNEGNSALHLAAKLRENKPWWISGTAALQMQWENIWYEYVRDSMPSNFSPGHNKEGKTPSDLFTETHIELAKSGTKWLNSTSASCSVVTALIATVAFATSTSVPGGFTGDFGIPALQNMPGFDLFAISSLVALCFSIISLVMCWELF